MAVRTFLDSNILIAAWLGREDSSSKAMSVLFDFDREIVATSLVALETVGHASYNNRTLELQFYKEFFDYVVTGTVEVDETLVADAMLISKTIDADGIDAPHLAAAVRLGAEDFITTEKRTKPMFREQWLR